MKGLAALMVVGLILLMPLASAETELQFLNDMADILGDTNAVGEKVVDAMYDFADGWITEAQFYALISQYRDELQTIEDRVDAKNAPCSAYEDYLWHMQMGVWDNRLSLDYVLKWLDYGLDWDYDTAIDLMQSSANHLRDGNAILESLSVPACDTSDGNGNGGGGTIQEDGGYSPLFSASCGLSIALMVVVAGILFYVWRRNERLKALEEERKQKELEKELEEELEVKSEERCFICGAFIPDGSEKCPLCGWQLTKVPEGEAGDDFRRL